ncbi:MAG: recombinase family protein [Nitrosopumilaceae archaeon]
MGSGVNFNRRGLKRLLAKVDSGLVDEIVVAHKDRLARVGFGLIEFLLERRGVVLKISKHCKTNETIEQSSAEELLAIVTYYAARFHGKRKYTGGGNDNSYAETTILSNARTKEKFEDVLKHFEGLLQQRICMD